MGTISGDPLTQYKPLKTLPALFLCLVKPEETNP